LLGLNPLSHSYLLLTGECYVRSLNKIVDLFYGSVVRISQRDLTASDKGNEVASKRSNPLFEGTSFAKTGFSKIS